MSTDVKTIPQEQSQERSTDQPTAPGEANMMEKILECAREYATEGEIRNAMREVYGDYVETVEF